MFFEETPHILKDPIWCSRLPTYEKIILIIIRSIAELYGRAWPSEATIARLASCSERHVRNCLRSLEEKGLIKVIQRQGTSNFYLLPTYYKLKGEELIPVWEQVLFEKLEDKKDA